MRMMLVLIATAVFNLQGCTTTDSAKDEKKPAEGAAAAPKESWLEKTEKNAGKELKKVKEKGLPYYTECKVEIEKYCKAEEKEPTKIGDCMKKNKDKFGPTCKAAVEKYFKENK